MKKYILIICPIIVLVLFSCEDEFLDRKIDTNYTEEQVFSTYSTMKAFGLGMYTYLPGGFARIDGAMLAAATDDAVHSGTGTAIKSLTNGSWGPFNNPDNQWSYYYSGIRKANKFLENTVDYEHILFRDTISDEGIQEYTTQVTDIKRLRAEARFLRAFFHFELMKRYGGVPIITEVLSEDDPIETRNSYEECTEFVVSELDACVEDLIADWADYLDGVNIGRATKGSAMALKARALLYAASPLHNESGDLSKWEEAAAAAYDVIDLGQYSLAGNYRTLFRSIRDNEIIFARRYSASNTLESYNYPVGFEGVTGGVNPSQNLIDAYETINGLSINEDPEYDPQDPYSDRDPRLGMTIIVNNEDYKGRSVEVWEGGKDSRQKPRGTRTGYYLKKFADEALDLSQDKTSAHTCIYFRYADILLTYAEAMNEAYGPDNAADFGLTAIEAVNMVRQRSGVEMPPVSTDSKEEFRERIRNERRIELAFEENRFWDTRRWEIAEETLGSPIYRVEVIRKGEDSFTYNYPAKPVEERVFESQMYLYPIPRVEVIKTGSQIKQNEGW